MFLTYLDESGKPNYNDTENEYVLAAITIHESEYKHVEGELSRIKRNYFDQTNCDDVEIHATNIISRKGIFSEMNVTKRMQLLKDVLGILNQINSTVNCIIIRKDLLKNKMPDVDNITYKFMFERLCITHNQLNNKLLMNNSDPQFGILFMDSIQPKYDELIKSKIRQLIKEGTEHTSNDYIIEDLVFVDSRYRAMSQIADCIAFVIRRYHRLKYSNSAKEDEMMFYEECFKIIRPHIRDNNGNINGAGLKIYPKTKLAELGR